MDAIFARSRAVIWQDVSLNGYISHTPRHQKEAHRLVAKLARTRPSTAEEIRLKIKTCF